MKKFLSLVLALVMTMSLVTISAGATEYKDFTDKDEIQYAEAVTVLNKLGIITGYSEGDFRPEGELTRGAAAKILVSLLIGPDAANALGNENSPYPDVPAGNTFAGVISYCKTAKLINGYSDGTFRPQGTLTGYAFAKMLLGALGYKSEYEGFTGAGWNMNVARLGGEANLFDRISFNGNATVTREQACQLALNTLKGTMVEYSGGMNITNGGQSVVVNPTRNYKTSNQEYATHINNKKATGKAEDDYYTVEFGEEHFVDLRMSKTETTAYDSFGRPSNEWSWKKVTIGTFPIEPDYVFTSQVAHQDATDAAKNRATGLGGFKLNNGLTGDDYATTNVCLNGKYNELNIAKIADIADYTDNGTVVEVYIDDDIADFIRDVVVIKSQLMEVRRVGSDYVALQREDNKAADKPEAAAKAYNQERIDVVVENVQPEDDDYATLSALKAGDLVVVTPVYDDASQKYEVGGVYIPETVSGAITAVDTYGVSGQGANSKKAAVGVTVGGTNYKISLWARDLYDVTSDEVKITRKDVTLYLDRYGYAMKSKDIGDTSDWFIIGSFYSTMVENKIVTMAKGWDTNGNEMELNLGTGTGVRKGFVPGDLVRYTNSTSNNADWSISDAQTALINTTDYDEIKTSDVYIPLEQDSHPYLQAGGESVTVDKGIKFIYVTFEADSDDVQSIDIKNGVQNAKQAELLKTSKGGTLKAQAGFSLNDAKTAANAVKVVVIKNESNEAIATNMMYIRTQDGGGIKDANGNMIYRYTVDMMTPDGLEEKTTIYSDDQLRENTFAAYTAKEHADFSPFYDLRAHNNFTGRTTSTAQATLAALNAGNKYLIRVKNFAPVLGTQGTPNGALDGTMKVSMDPRNLKTTGNGGEAWTLDISNAEFVDLRSDKQLKNTNDEAVHSRDDFYQIAHDYLDKGATKDNELTVGEETWTLQMIINDNDSNSGFRRVAMVVITDQDDSAFTSPINFTPADGGSEGPGEGTQSSAKDVTLTINSAPDKSWTNAQEDVRLTTTEAGAGMTKITLTPSENAKITAVRQNGTLAYIADDATNTKLTVNTQPVDGDLLIVDVEAQNGTTARYTFLFKVYNPDNWTNEFVTGLGITTGTDGYTAASWTGTISTILELTGTSLKAAAPILLTDNDADVKGQLRSAMEANGIDVKLENITTNGPKTVWKMVAEDGFEYTWTPAATTSYLAYYKTAPDAAKKPYIVTPGTDKIAAASRTNAMFDSDTLAGGIDADGTPVPVANYVDEPEMGVTYTAGIWSIVTVKPDVTEGNKGTIDTTVGSYYYSTNVGDAAEAAAGDYFLKDDDTITMTVVLDDASVINATKDTVTVTVTGAKVNGKADSDNVEFTSASTTLTKDFVITAPAAAATLSVVIAGSHT